MIVVVAKDDTVKAVKAVVIIEEVFVIVERKTFRPADIYLMFHQRVLFERDCLGCVP